MTLTKLERWELSLRGALDEVDRALEQEFKDRLSPSPRRPAVGSTSSPRYDGLFGLSSMFSLGLATGDGPGYVIEVRISSGSPVSHDLQESVLASAERLLVPALGRAFPGRSLTLERQGDRFRLKGDLDLS